MNNNVVAQALLLDATLPRAEEEVRERQAAQDAAEIQQTADRLQAEAAAEQARRTSAAQRSRRIDGTAVRLGALAAMSIVIPWAIGHFVLRGRIFSEDPGVFEPEIRALLPYFWAELVAGWSVIALIVGAVLVCRPWTARVAFGSVGVVLLIGGIWALNTGKSLFAGAEEDSIAKLSSTAFPFTQRYLECGHALELTVRAPEGTTVPDQLWQMYLGSDKGYTGEGCNRVSVYKGWIYMGYLSLTDGDEFDDSSDARWTYVGANDEVLASNSWVQNHDPAEVWLNVRTEWGRTVSTNLLDAGNNGLAIR
ncbi:hypothetical protein C7T36_13885 [Rhodococcus sp. AD45-ID]|uniref:hypothetical protein n=1 Tax=Rhodococcus TaxID=1827 RepID=UPI0005D45FEE|nr:MULTISPECIES: hypothetical protein [Rhodococcus]KJF24927.1 hypothetical protein SZ00_01853 [Rhodococcus sp. AD45]PSR43155.1 hypothetical protein C7T36_13885 [Rhodococcus sp. AD45-ID]QXW00618.1 hypothetical protein KYT97_19715 [Rhodococcus globerulus]